MWEYLIAECSSCTFTLATMGLWRGRTHLCLWFLKWEVEPCVLPKLTVDNSTKLGNNSNDCQGNCIFKMRWCGLEIDNQCCEEKSAQQQRTSQQFSLYFLQKGCYWQMEQWQEHTWTREKQHIYPWRIWVILTAVSSIHWLELDLTVLNWYPIC